MASFTYLILVPSIDYQQYFAEHLKEVIRASKKICFVTLNKTYGVVLSQFGQEGITPERVVYIDRISKAIFATEPNPNVTFISSPIKIEELEAAVDKVLKDDKIDGFVFDSVSTLAVYDDHEKISAFLARLVAKLRERKIISLFVCLLEDSRKDIVTHMTMNVDKVQEIREIGKKEW